MPKVMLVWFLIYLPWCSLVCAQDLLIHSHNDYAQEIPLWNALRYGMNSIEIDIVRQKSTLIVSHDDIELDQKPNIQDLYLIPLYSYLDTHRTNLTLLIDLKTTDWQTIDLLDSVVRLNPTYYQTRIDDRRNAPIRIILSGDIPRVELGALSKYQYFFLDGRPSDLESVLDTDITPWISTNLSKITSWRGNTKLTRRDRRRIQNLADKVHSRRAKLRFWNTPDSEEVWTSLLYCGVDILGTDDAKKLSHFRNNIE